MSDLRGRLSRLEAKLLPKPPSKPQPTFLWCSEADSPALEEAQRRADADGQDLFIIKLVPADMTAGNSTKDPQ